MVGCASSHIPQGSIELSNEPLQHAWPALAAGAPWKYHLAPSRPLIFNLFGMCNRLWSGAWCSVDLCQPGLRIWRDRCQPSMEGAVLNTLRWVGECTVLALWCRLLELPVSCCSSQASFYFGNRTSWLCVLFFWGGGSRKLERKRLCRDQSQASRATVDMKHSSSYCMCALTQSHRIRGKSYLESKTK